MPSATAVDAHQHLWPEHLVDRLRARTRPPFLDGWTLHTDAEPPFEVDPADHDVAARTEADRRCGVGLSCVSLSAPLGIEYLERPQADELLASWHEGARALPAHFAAWASAPVVDPDLEGLADLLRDGFAGVQVPATEVSSPGAWERTGDVLRVAERAGKPVFVHPGPDAAHRSSEDVPAWWAPVVGYVAQLQAAWWAWQAVRGRQLFPTLRVLFGAGAGLAPVHQERHAARGGESARVDPALFVDTSSYGPQGLDALARVLGVDALTLGSDRPYGVPVDRILGDAATHAVRVANPRRLLTGDPLTHERTRTEGQGWPRAS